MVVRFNFPRTYVNDLLEDFLSDVTPVLPTNARTYPVLELAEYENESVLVAELPGVNKEDLKISVENGLLTISGERKPCEVPQNARVLLNEMRVRNFSRSVELPHDVDVNKISAELQNGVLRITLPKTESAQLKEIRIN